MQIETIELVIIFPVIIWFIDYCNRPIIIFSRNSKAAFPVRFDQTRTVEVFLPSCFSSLCFADICFFMRHMKVWSLTLLNETPRVFLLFQSFYCRSAAAFGSLSCRWPSLNQESEVWLQGSPDLQSKPKLPSELVFWFLVLYIHFGLVCSERLDVHSD